MRNRPNGAELLTIARRTLLDSLLPALPKERAYEALMVANAMAIALREMQADSDAADADLAAFLADAPHAETQGGERALAALIRARAVPREQQPRLHQLLLALTRDKLQLSNPKYLRSTHPVPPVPPSGQV